MIKVEPEGLTMIAEQAMIDIAHLLRPAHLQVSHTGPSGQLVASQTADPGEGRLIPARPNIFVQIGLKIISMVILLLPLIQEGLLSVTRESICTKQWLTA